MIRHSLIFAFAIFLGGCATTYSPKDLPAAKSRECITIAEDSYWREERGMLGIFWEEGLSAGVYTSQYEDKKGIFFAGNGRPIWQAGSQSLKDPAPSPTDLRNYRPGGIWLPKSAKEGPRMYYVFEANPAAAKDVGTVSSGIAQNQVNQGAAVGPAALGGAIGGAIVNAMIQADDGKLFLHPDIKDVALAAQLRNVGTCPATASPGEAVKP